jgi:hypothetical protein
MFAVLVYWGLVSLPHPLSLGQGQCSISQPPDVSVLWQFPDCFSILQCCLTLDIAHWLRRWALLTTTCSISGSSYHPPTVGPSAFPNFESSCGDHLLSPPPFSGALMAPCPLYCVLVFSSLFIQFFVLFCFVWGGGRGAQSTQGDMLVYPRGGWRNTAWCLVLTCWPAECLPSRFGTSVWQHRSPPVFSV